MKTYLRENALYLGVILLILTLAFDHIVLPLLWLLVITNQNLQIIVNILIHLNAFLFFLGFMLIITKLTGKKKIIWLIFFSLIYFIGGAFLLAYLLYLPYDMPSLLSQIFRWPILASYIFL